VGLKWNGTHQLLVYADEVNLLGDNINTIQKNIETLTDASKEVGLKVNAEKTKYKLLFHHQNAVQNHDIQTANRSFENVAQFKYLGMKVTNQNLSGNGFQRHNFLSFCVHVLTGRRLSHNLLNSRLILLRTPQHRPHRKNCFQQFFYRCNTQLSHILCREHLFPVSQLVSVRNLLPSNGRCLQSHYLATGLHTTIQFTQGI
jgi:hypothetical protein